VSFIFYVDKLFISIQYTTSLTLKYLIITLKIRLQRKCVFLFAIIHLTNKIIKKNKKTYTTFLPFLFPHVRFARGGEGSVYIF